MVSDFITPHYHDPSESRGARYSFTGAIKEPREVLVNGYVSFNDVLDDAWYVASNAGGVMKFKKISNATPEKSLREHVHQQARLLGLPIEDPNHSYHGSAENVKTMKKRRGKAILASDAAARIVMSDLRSATRQRRSGR
jgi:hypothetical protein